ncbi:MAG: BNR/Asp-box repeat protein [Candidatus Scalindua rubra]|uniref:BNR/Asp-box repeat protein n=1 Tax=Candidatus Scalindua rubra TaxID=1872076 RepID=A0A1E3XGB2_9BACT|nr:MAG: BNR/Asp-box repeat protein [Candidatus Scalindua rubra]
MKDNDNLLLLSEKGILNSDNQPYSNVPFQNVPVVAGDVYRDQVAVIVDKHEVWTFASGEWHRVADAATRLNCIRWTSDKQLLVSTESARLAWLTDGTLKFIDSFDEVPERKLWTTPWGGPPDVRSLAVSKDGTIYANVHVGWIVRSRDGGKTWKNLREGLDMDVHQVAAHPSNPAVVFAATAEGFYLSKDLGETFTRQNDDMPYRYERACACFPDTDVYLLSTSRGPHGYAEARVYRSEDEGIHWKPVNGLPEGINKNINTFQIIIIRDGNAWLLLRTRLYMRPMIME